MTEIKTALVSVNINNHVADVRLNRAEKMNALNIPMFEAIRDVGKQLAADKSIRAVVLSGEGRGFCAGLDLANFTDPEVFADPFGPGRGGFYPNFYQLPGYAWKAIPVPVICALHGVAYGGGLQIALGADIRIAHPEAKLSVMEIKWGLIPDMSASQTLRDLVRLDVAKELTFTGRVVTGQEAVQLGLVTSLSDDPREAALAMAAEIARRNPNAIAYGKYLLNNTRHGDDLEGLRVEERLQAKILKSPNQIESVMSEMEGREGQFSDREFTAFDDIVLD
ncbi:crotonase/enoyl-CoA hydratase family protein [Aestuariicella hydrocarbonica]|uniref:Crotonase/enoyl-CoA hydratase family protein n=1 Tax=Pseudomaricurvus hydrocarbonicus TaxID=1470433 RepID=A0A9E5JYF2_9GAMM|nr:crotonase/enoyl-CoA hydratase family protein [Aestuariicella hydrocarbonica]NHO66956.1 crotonase/enoyl-CoA hydratase family protein [Aestuariicella hydrocarbonica]